MSTRRITVTMTEAEAWNLLRLAECAGNTYEDALAVLVSPAKVRAGYRGCDVLRSSLSASSVEPT